MLYRICTVQVQPRKHVLDHADYTAPTRQHGLDHTDQQSICPEGSRSSLGTDYLAHAWKLVFRYQHRKYGDARGRGQTALDIHMYIRFSLVDKLFVFWAV